MSELDHIKSISTFTVCSLITVGYMYYKHRLDHSRKQEKTVFPDWVQSKVYSPRRTSEDLDETHKDEAIVMANGLDCTELYPISHLSNMINNLQEYNSPLLDRAWPVNKNFVGNNETIIETQIVTPLDSQETRLLREFISCGPREKVVFHQSEVKAVIVTCGGLCPGLNTVIREITMALIRTYGCRDVYGALGGYSGLVNGNMKRLTPNNVNMIHQEGGTILGSSRGGFDLDNIVNTLVEEGFNQVYIIGGDGTHRGALKIANEVKRLKLRITVAAVPKTIDNDIALIDRSFGFETSVSEAMHPIQCAAVEAKGAPNCIGLIKLMGRHSGFISLHATLASRQVDACLIPEMNFKLNELFDYVEARLKEKGYCIIVVAEGAGQDHLEASCELDPSGNPVFGDIGLFLKQRLNKYFTDKDKEINLKYIDPTYMIRSVPANAADSLMCSELAFSVVHGCMAGFTNFSVGLIDNHYVMLPIAVIAAHPPVRVNITGRAYARMCMSTHQPTFGGRIVQHKRIHLDDSY